MNVYTLENEKHKISFLDYGAILYEWIYKPTNKNIILSNANLEDYKNTSYGYMGMTIGPVTNRIKRGNFNVDGVNYQIECNENNNTLHSGTKGFWNKTFILNSITKDTIIFSLNTNLDSDGFPGNKETTIVYRLLDNGLRIEFNLKTDMNTPVNLTNHAYFNLNGFGSILDHDLYINSNSIINVDSESIPIGFRDIKDTYFDFNNTTRIEDNLNKHEGFRGIDHHYVFNDDKVLVLSNKDINMEVTTSYPGVQVYTGNYPGGQELNDNRVYELHGGIAIEPQYEIDAINNGYNDIIVTPNKDYYEWIEYKITDK